MKKLIAASVLILLFSSVQAVEGNNASGDLTVTSKPNLNPGGLNYEINFSEAGKSPLRTGDLVENVTVNDSRITLQGILRNGYPCGKLNYSVRGSGSTYTANIGVSSSSEDPQVCTAVVTGFYYNLSFEADPKYTLILEHKGERVESFQVNSSSDDSVGDTDKVEEVSGESYSATIRQLERGHNQSTGNITDLTVQEGNVSFRGGIQTPNPCYRVTPEINETENGYVFNVETMSTLGPREGCIAVLGSLGYSATFEAEGDFTLEIRHDGEKIREVEVKKEDREGPREDEEASEQDKGSLIQSLLDLLGL